MPLYADITDLVIEKDEAWPEEVVNFVAFLKNLYTSTVSMKMTGYFKYNESIVSASFNWDYINVQPGYTVTFAGNFVMPSLAGRLYVYSYWYGGDGQWHTDDGMNKPVGLASGIPIQIISVGNERVQ